MTKTNGEKPMGPFPKDHQRQLTSLLRSHFEESPIVGVEIGTGSGIITQAILSLPNVVRLWTIDPWEYRKDATFEAGRGPQSWHNERMHIALDKMRDRQCAGRVVVCIMDSDEAISVIPDKVNFVWIDGHHTEEQVYRDVNNYRAIICEGGLIGGHDFGMAGGVKRAVESIFTSSEIKVGDDTTWWMIKE